MENVSPCKFPIHWKLLSDATLHYYFDLNAIYVETPWIVDPMVAAFTAPSNEIKTSYGQLVGSAEQGFLQLAKNKDPKIKYNSHYQSISPCFRIDEVDELHDRHFMKLELFYLLDPNRIKCTETVEEEHKILDAMVESAESFFKDNGIKTKIVTDMNSNHLTCDIVGEKSGIELGSYGIREIDGIEWIYGTGLALPRFSQVLEKENV